MIKTEQSRLLDRVYVIPTDEKAKSCIAAKIVLAEKVNTKLISSE
tara:strand:+ start:113 stop:247 length:135 start_codon:yes stop_codon:yes gene_type:complete